MFPSGTGSELGELDQLLLDILEDIQYSKDADEQQKTHWDAAEQRKIDAGEGILARASGVIKAVVLKSHAEEYINLGGSTVGIGSQKKPKLHRLSGKN